MPLGPRPDEWDPNSVVGVRERLQISGFGIKKPLNFQDQISQHKWRYAAGDTGVKTKEQAASAHSNARTRVWNLEMAERASAIDKDDRTDEQKAAIQKVDNWWAYRQSRIGNSGGSPMIPPPAKWRPDLVGEERTGDAWRYAAELTEDGSAKTAKAHKNTRAKIIRDFRLAEANDKDPCDRTKEDDDVIAADVVEKEKQKKRRKASNKKRQKAQQDDNKAKIKKLFGEAGLNSTKFGEGEEREKTSRKWW